MCVYADDNDSERSETFLSCRLDSFLSLFSDRVLCIYDLYEMTQFVC